MCPACGHPTIAGGRFCNECGQPVAAASAATPAPVSPQSYTPRYLAEKILTSRHALEGERKQVTVLFADIKGEVPLGFVVTKAGVARPDGEIAKELVDKIRQQIGPVAAFKTALVVKRLPKTRSGKILRGTMKRIADSQAYTAPATIDDPAILDEITAALKGAGYAKGNA